MNPLASSHFPMLRVLCVDGNANMRRIYRNLLLGMNVREAFVAESGVEAFAMFRANRPDIVITEMNLPTLSGLELIKLIREKADGPLRFTPIIACVADATLSILTEARDLGVTEFLAKPISASSLRDRIETVIMNPRPFVDSPSFFGPDRRRSQRKIYKGPDRRAGRDGPAAGGAQPHHDAEQTP